MASNPLQEIENLVTVAFDNALKKEKIVFDHSIMVEQMIDGCSYQVHYVPGLKKKSEKNEKDPLAPPYEQDLHVCDLPGYGLSASIYTVLLNKFALSRNHFLLLPQEFAKQSDPLTMDDLSLTYQIVRNHKRKIMAFFNCGAESGASQKHKHIQFLSVSPSEPPIEVFLEDRENDEEARQLAQVQWAHFIISLHDPPEKSDQLGNYLMEKYMQLLDKMFNFIQSKEGCSATGSYNVLIMKTHIHVIPRSKAEFLLSNGSKVSMGSTSYAGIIHVKHEEDLDELKKAGVTNALLSVGLSRDV